MAIPLSFDWYRNLPNIPPADRNPAEDAGFGFANAFCNIVQSGGGPYAGGDGGGGGLGRAGRAVFGWVTNDVCEPYWTDQPEFAPPFEDGQCNCTYQVEVQVCGLPTGCTQNNSVSNRAGPITGVSVSPEPGTSRFFVDVGFDGGAQNWRVGVYTPGAGQSISATIIRATPTANCMGQNCGDPNPVPVPMPPPPVINNYGDDITYNGDTIGPTNINIGPPTYVDIDNSIEVPFTIDGIEFSFDISGGKGTRPKAARPSGLGDVDLTGEFNLPEAGPDDDQPFTGPLGIEWEVDGNLASLGAILDTDPIVFPRVVGNLQIKYVGADEMEFYGEAIRITNQRGFLPFEPGAVVVGFAASTLPQIGLIGRIVFRED